MTSSEDLSPQARQLLRQAKGADRATRLEVANSVQRFRTVEMQRHASRPSNWGLGTRRGTPWAVLATILSGTLGAYATVGQSLGLPLPRWWQELVVLPAFDGAAAERAAASAEPKTNAAQSRALATAATPSAAAGVETTPGSSEAVLAPVGSKENSDSMVSNGTENMRLTRQAPSRAQPRQSSASATASRTASAAIVPPDAPPAAGPLSQEVQTITAARDALNADDCSTALGHLEKHRLQFPKGALSEERQALSAICQCRQGRGSSVATAYVARHPSSPLGRRVAAECSLSTVK